MPSAKRLKPSYDQELRETIRSRMSPPDRETVAEITRSTGITAQSLYNWRAHWQKQGLLVHATTKTPEQGSPAVQLASVIRSAGMSSTDLAPSAGSGACPPLPACPLARGRRGCQQHHGSAVALGLPRSGDRSQTGPDAGTRCRHVQEASLSGLEALES